MNIISGLFVNFKSLSGSLLPIEFPSSFETLYFQSRVHFRIINYRGYRRSNSVDVKRINHQSRITNNFWQTRSISGDNWSPAFHGFEWWKPKTLEEGWINETQCSRIERWQIALRYIARGDHILT